MPSHRLRTAFFLAGFVLACVSLSVSADEKKAVYGGMLGHQAIVMELGSGDGDGLDGRYFYRRHHRDLLLTDRTGTADHVHLFEGSDDDSPRPEIDLVRQPDGHWTGTWRSPQGKTLALTLQPAIVPPPAADAPDYLKQLRLKDPYEYLRLSGLTLHAGPRTTFMGHTLQWWTEADSKITLFDIVDGYPDDQRRRLNGVLMDRLWNEVSSFYACMAGASGHGEGDYEQTVTPHLMTPSLFSVSLLTSYDCGGAHPDFGDGPLNLDARTARPLTLEDILWLGKGMPFHYNDSEDDAPAADGEPNSVDFDAFSAYRTKSLSPWLAQQFATLYPAKMTSGNADEDECGYDDPSVWEFPSWHMETGGLFIGPSFARVARVCEANDDWSLLPWAVVKQHPGRLRLALP
ncbi:MAG TPA: hypothetical protein VLZ32_14230 [Rhodanobacter sp.]|nr:hypothetical protein [Rhodanobacter sp.]